MFLWIYFWSILLHPFYVSVCEIEVNEKSKKAEMSVKIFADDTEKMLKTRYQQTIFLQNELGKNAAIDSLLHDYIQQNIILVIDEKRLKWQWVGAELEGDALWCYLEMPYSTSAQTIELKNTLFLELFDSQTNIVHIRKGNQRRSDLLKANKNTLKMFF